MGQTLEEEVLKEIDSYITFRYLDKQMKQDIAKLLQTFYERRKEQEWVSVEERLPDEEGEYLCCDQFHYCPGKEKANIYRVLDFKFSVMRTTGERVIDEDGITGGFQDKNAYGQRVTHWQPLPSKPKTL